MLIYNNMDKNKLLLSFIIFIAILITYKSVNKENFDVQLDFNNNFNIQVENVKGPKGLQGPVGPPCKNIISQLENRGYLNLGGSNKLNQINSNVQLSLNGEIKDTSKNFYKLKINDYKSGDYPLIIGESIENNHLSLKSVEKKLQLSLKGDIFLRNGKIKFTNPVYNDMLSNSTSSDNIEKNMYNTAPRGIIAAFYKNTDNSIPVGWAICNGQEIEGFKTPNLIGKFIKGGSEVGKYHDNDDTFDEINRFKDGTLKLTTENMPIHTHEIQRAGKHKHSNSNIMETPGHSHTLTASHGEAYSSGDTVSQFKLYKKSDLATGSNTFNTGDSVGHGHIGAITEEGEHEHIALSVGNGKSINISPPWYSLVYIIKYK